MGRFPFLSIKNYYKAPILSVAMTSGWTNRPMKHNMGPDTDPHVYVNAKSDADWNGRSVGKGENPQQTEQGHLMV